MKRMQKKQAGFTILEIGIVMIILVSLVVAFSSGLWEKQEAADIQMVKLWFVKEVPEAIATCRLRHGNIITGTGSTVVDDSDMEECGLNANTHFGSTWDGTYSTPGQISIAYNLAGSSNANGVGDAVAALLSSGGSSHIVSSSYGTGVLTVVVKAR